MPLVSEFDVCLLRLAGPMQTNRVLARDRRHCLVCRAGACCAEPELWRRLVAGPIFRWRMVRRRAPRRVRRAHRKHARGLEPVETAATLHRLRISG
jgi:hypothetical protein